MGPKGTRLRPRPAWMIARDRQCCKRRTIKLRGAAAFCRVPLERVVRLPSVFGVNLYFARSQVVVTRPMRPGTPALIDGVQSPINRCKSTCYSVVVGVVS